MKKISTLFKKDPNDLGRVVNEVNPENQWVIDGEGFATRKYDGTAAAVINGELYKRYDVKKGRQVPEGAIPCQEPDAITGHWPHWVKVDVRGKEDKYFVEAWFNYSEGNNVFPPDGTYEVCGPKIQGNPEGFVRHILVRHGDDDVLVMRNWDSIKSYFERPYNDIEGIVFHHPDGRMCKIRKSDFGIKR